MPLQMPISYHKLDYRMEFLHLRTGGSLQLMEQKQTYEIQTNRNTHIKYDAEFVKNIAHSLLIDWSYLIIIIRLELLPSYRCLYCLFEDVLQ